MCPKRSERPHLVTMLRSSSVTPSMSFEAPVVTCSTPKMSSSATRPPKRLEIWLSSRSLLALKRRRLFPYGPRPVTHLRKRIVDRDAPVSTRGSPRRADTRPRRRRLALGRTRHFGQLERDPDDLLAVRLGDSDVRFHGYLRKLTSSGFTVSACVQVTPCGPPPPPPGGLA